MAEGGSAESGVVGVDDAAAVDGKVADAEVADVEGGGI